MKKFYFTLLALVACTLTHAATQIQVGDLWFELGKTYATVIADMSGSKTNYATLTEAVIPSSVKYDNYDYVVTTIGQSAFENSPKLQSVTIPSSVTTINQDAFYGCSKLSNVSLPEGLTTINQRAFWGCNLKDITIPSTVTTIGNAAFKSNPTTSVLWKPVTCSISSGASAPFYSESSQITSFIFGESVEQIPGYLCKNMSKLDTVVLPPSVHLLGDAAFMYCTSLKSINLPKTQKNLPASFFEGCTVLESIELPSTLINIRSCAFYNCSKLSNVTLHEGIETIESSAFWGCNLKDITIPSTVTSIGSGAFKGNPTTSVTWLPPTCSISSDSSAPFYSEYSQITSFTFGDKVETIPAYLCKHMSKLDTVVLPPSVHLLGDAAFMYCTSLKSINLPKTQKTLPASFLEGCTSLESIELPATLTTIRSSAFYNCSKLSNVTLHEGIETIESIAFWGCNLKDITIPSTVTSIGSGAFKGNPTTSVTWLPPTCSISSDASAPFYSEYSQITSFTFGDKVETIPAYLCKHMSKLDTVVLPPSVKSLGQAAFMYCTSLKSINLPVTQKTLPASFLEGCTSLESIELPATLTTIRSCAFYNCSKLSNVTLHEGIETIESSAFWGCNLKDITIPSTVTSIGSGAFKGNPTTSVTWLPPTCSISSDSSAPFYSEYSTITSFTFGENVQIIPNYLCYKMGKLDTVVLPPNVQTIGNYAFSYCSALKGVNIPASVTMVARNSFSYCKALKSFAFPEGISTVATEVLEGCTALEEVFIPTSVTTINQYAFYNCSALKAIYNFAKMPQTITQNVVYNVDKTKCSLYVPAEAYSAYVAAEVWREFLLKELPTIYYEFEETACDSYTWNGKTYTTSQNVVETFRSVAGLDSIVTLHLTINHASSGEESKTAEGSYIWHDKTYTESGHYKDTLTNAVGCDSIVTLHLTITLPPIYYEFSETACDSYKWNGKTYTTSQNVVETFKAVTGQDSIVTLHLTINHSSAGEEYQTAEGSYEWHGETYTESGNYPYTLTNVAGCDSIATLHLTIIPLWKVTVQQPSNGTIAIQETGIDLTKVVDGTLLHFIATPDEGYHFDAWSGCEEDGSLLVKANANVTCTFALDPPTDIDPLYDDIKATKILRDGHLLIQRGDKTYTITGKEVQ